MPGCDGSPLHCYPPAACVMNVRLQAHGFMPLNQIKGSWLLLFCGMQTARPSEPPGAGGCKCLVGSISHPAHKAR